MITQEDLKTKELYITTDDNPFDPKDDFRSWYNYDLQMGYNTNERLSRLANTSESLSDYENNQELYDAMLQLTKSIAISKSGKFAHYKILIKDK